jgi:hypothetical protein|tara:strand:+ start:425 stop:2038 length:1614 start_codon:yes stop_codon:yes gene_type:complete
MTQDIIFIADVFVDRVPQGGAEIVNNLLIEDLRSQGHNVLEVETFRVDKSLFTAYHDAFFIVSGMLGLRSDAVEGLLASTYVVYEHDHKYEVDRNPALYSDFKVPENRLRYTEIYENAQAIVCQSSFHQEILQKNIPSCKKVINAGGSMWSTQFLDVVEKAIQTDIPKNQKAAIIKSTNEIKGQPQAEEYCKQNNIDYDLIEAPNPQALFEKLSHYEYFIFFPSTPETFSRIFMEAKLAKCKVITNSLVGATYENYTFNDANQLLKEIKESRLRICSLFMDMIPSLQAPSSKPLTSSKPLVSIITSVYQGEKYIDGFMEEITKQSFFDRCELILVDCNCGNSPYEKETIKKFQETYPNIHYYKLDEDPGVYGAWNYAINHSEGEYITNANLDDRRCYSMIEQCYNFATANSEKDLVYACFLVTDKPNETFYTTRSQQVYNTLDFSIKNMQHCPPGCMPLWRRSLHQKNGMFDDSLTSAGDLEFWLRCIKNKSEFVRLNAVLGLYYFNPDGLSTSPQNHHRKIKEEQKVFDEYKDLFR